MTLQHLLGHRKNMLYVRDQLASLFLHTVLYALLMELTERIWRKIKPFFEISFFILISLVFDSSVIP